MAISGDTVINPEELFISITFLDEENARILYTIPRHFESLAIISSRGKIIFST